MKKYLLSILISSIAYNTYADQVEYFTELHSISNNISQHSNFELITQSLFEQMREYVDVKNSDLSSMEIDVLVKQYIAESYAPIFVRNYSQIYSELRKENKDFSDCEDLIPFKDNVDVLQSLCLKKEGILIQVQYWTNGYKQGWSKSITYNFKKSSGLLELVSMEIPLSKNQKVHIPNL